MTDADTTDIFPVSSPHSIPPIKLFGSPVVTETEFEAESESASTSDSNADGSDQESLFGPDPLIVLEVEDANFTFSTL